VNVVIYPAQVQGDAAAAEVAAGVRYFNDVRSDVSRSVEVIIVGRGGGSTEDLAAFNDEGLARAVAASGIPVISAVGHETDFTIVDFVADLRAATPSAAAELVIRSRVEVETQAEAVRERLVRAMERRLLEARHALMERAQHGAFARMMDLIRQRQQKLDDLTYRLERGERQTLELMRRRWETLAAAVRHYDLRRVLAGIRGELGAGTAALAAAMRNQLLQNKVRIERFGRALETLSPLAILERGYALVFDSAGQLVKDAGLVKAGDEISARVARGEIRAVVKKAGTDKMGRRKQEQ
jgi:exodeoxyribonuclease VII large subunit